MATINNAFLALGPAPNNQVDVIVICQVTLAPSENQSQFRLECKVFGSDLLKDDLLFSYDPELFSGFNPSTDFRFQKRVSRGALNEDRVGNDEVIGKLTLRNLTLNRVVKQNTNVADVV
jgi:hypothetical protein